MLNQFKSKLQLSNTTIGFLVSTENSMFLNNYNGPLKYSVYAFMTKLAASVGLVPALN